MMEIKEIKQKLKKRKISYKNLSSLSGVPLNTLKNIFSERTSNPRIDTMQAIEKALGLADSSPLANAMVEQLTDKERRLLKAFNALIEPMQDIMLEQMEKMADIRTDDNEHRKQA